VYWKPVWHVLEGHFELVLANAAHVKSMPGRKTGVNDAMWLADLLAHGLSPVSAHVVVAEIGIDTSASPPPGTCCPGPACAPVVAQSRAALWDHNRSPIRCEWGRGSFAAALRNDAIATLALRQV
jgi:hypothetical protein